MNKTAVVLLKATRRIYTKLFLSAHQKPGLRFDFQGQPASDLIREILNSKEPCMISRFGSYELEATLNYLDIHYNGCCITKSVKYILNEIGPFWRDKRIVSLLCNNAGFYPANEDFLNRFANTMLKDIQNIDILGSWLIDEARLAEFIPNAKTVPLLDLEPYYHANPWSDVLKGKKVLVIHPFEQSIKKQYARRRLLFKDPKVLPEFELRTIKAVQSIAGNKIDFSNWFEALAWMCNRVADIDFDIAIIGAGAYGLPLASFVKSIDKKAIHLGGATQLLFGIKGKRWDEHQLTIQLYNENWIRPMPKETPNNYQAVESGCYW